MVNRAHQSSGFLIRSSMLVPEGLGKGKSVVVWAGDQNLKLDNAMWGYDVPEVTSVTPDHCRTFGDS